MKQQELAEYMAIFLKLVLKKMANFEPFLQRGTLCKNGSKLAIFLSTNFRKAVNSLILVRFLA